MIKEYFNIADNSKAKIAIFLSGSGSNTEELLKKQFSEGDDCAYEVSVLLADRTKNCRIAELGKKFDIPIEIVNIKEFYANHGLQSISLASENGQKVRELWTAELYSKLQDYEVDFAVLAGFIPLTNIAKFLPCLNVHPGDLLIEEDGKRLLVGLHEAPIEIAIIKGYNSLKSSVIIVEPYESLNDMDSGALLGVSESSPIDLQNYSLKELQQIYKNRDQHRPIGGYKDILHELASYNQELLKSAGDYIVLPQVVENFAKKLYAKDDTNYNLYFRENLNSNFNLIKTVKYSQNDLAQIIKGSSKVTNL